MDKRSRYNRLQVRLEKLMHCQKIDADIIMCRQQSQMRITVHITNNYELPSAYLPEIRLSSQSYSSAVRMRSP